MEEAVKQGFDLQVTFRDEKTGQIIKTNPYCLRIVGNPDGTRMRLWERPVGSGNIWNKKGEPAGRWINGKFAKGEPHIAFEAPLTEDQKLAKSLVDKDARIAALEKELQSLKGEAKKKQGS